MYTEIKEAVNFVAAYLLGKIPRRTVSLFCQEFANLLLRRYEQMWCTEDHKRDEERRKVKVFGEDRSLDPLIRNAMKMVGMNEDDARVHFPENLVIYVNPGSVFFKLNDRGTPVPIWIGSIDADLEYQSYPEHALKTGAIENATFANNMGAAGRPIHARGSDGLVDNFVPLQVETMHPALIDSPLPVTGELKHFVFVGKDQRTFLVADFALTRFGSHKNRPDHENMKQIKDRAGVVNEELVRPVPTNEADVAAGANIPGSPHWQIQEQAKSMTAEERYQLIQHLAMLNSGDLDQQSSYMQDVAHDVGSSYMQDVPQSYINDFAAMNLMNRNSKF